MVSSPALPRNYKKPLCHPARTPPDTNTVPGSEGGDQARCLLRYILLISSHVNGGSSLASPCPGAGTQAASSRPGLWGISPPPPAQPSQPSPAQPSQPSPGFTFYGRVEGWGALGAGQGCGGGHRLHKPFSKCVVWGQSGSDSS